jgi:hypothetical protein
MLPLPLLLGAQLLLPLLLLVLLCLMAKEIDRH